MTSLSVNFSTKVFLLFSGSLCLTILNRLFLLILLSNYQKSICLRRLSVHEYNQLKTPVLLTVFLLLFVHVVRRCFPLLLVLFLKNIINTCVWPAAWKCGFTTPILKSGSPNDITNYQYLTRPWFMFLRKFSLVTYLQ